jgi:hypothetical protein
MAKTKKSIDELVAEEMERYKQAHQPKILMKYGNTYVTVYPIYSDRPAERLKSLFELMNLNYSVDLTKWDEDNEVTFMFSGEDENRAKFIQKFIDNHFKLTWE